MLYPTPAGIPLGITASAILSTGDYRTGDYRHRKNKEHPLEERVSLLIKNNRKLFIIHIITIIVTILLIFHTLYQVVNATEAKFYKHE